MDWPKARSLSSSSDLGCGECLCVPPGESGDSGFPGAAFREEGQPSPVVIGSGICSRTQECYCIPVHKKSLSVSTLTGSASDREASHGCSLSEFRLGQAGGALSLLLGYLSDTRLASWLKQTQGKSCSCTRCYLTTEETSA